MDNVAYFKEQFDRLESTDALSGLRQSSMKSFSNLGIPTTRNEEWKYTRISSLFNREYLVNNNTPAVTAADIDTIALPEHATANVIVFVNGIFSSELSAIRSAGLSLCPLEEAAGNEYKSIVSKHLNHSSQYLKDGINALNTAFIHGGIFLHVHKNKVIDQPVYIYNITDARNGHVLSQPRSLVYVGQQAQVSFTETYHTLGTAESLTSQVMEMVVEQDAIVEYYKIQNEGKTASQVSTTHIRQVGKSLVNTVTITLDGGIVRNNLHAVMEAEHTEAHMYGLYFPNGTTHIDNHTIVDNAVPHCLSNEFYKGIMDGQSTGVFNGKIFVRKDAQKINAFQSNKNVLLSDEASVNTKPQLEIYADDVKCSHGCTVGSIDEESLFYLQSRGIPRKEAMALLLQGYATDILEKIKLEPVRNYVEGLIAKRLLVETV